MFKKGVMKVSGQELLQSPWPDKLKTIMDEYEAHRFLGCKGSVDEMHWELKNFPAGEAGKFQGKDKTQKTALRGVASHSLRFWHTFVGRTQVLKDINVVNWSPLSLSFINSEISRSPLFHLFGWGEADGDWVGPEDQVNFIINLNTYHQVYYLAEGIYQNLAVLVKSLCHETNPFGKRFSTLQEGHLKTSIVLLAFSKSHGGWLNILVGCGTWNLSTWW